jgi:RimJ/RimL family protein N-acetyltransferase
MTTAHQLIAIDSMPGCEPGLTLCALKSEDGDILNDLFSSFQQESPHQFDAWSECFVRVADEKCMFSWVVRVGNSEGSIVGVIGTLTTDNYSHKLWFWFKPDYWTEDVIAICLKSIGDHMSHESDERRINSLETSVPIEYAALHAALDKAGFVKQGLVDDKNDFVTYIKYLHWETTSPADFVDQYTVEGDSRRDLRAVIPASWFSLLRNGMLLDGDSLLLHLLKLTRGRFSRNKREWKKMMKQRKRDLKRQKRAALAAQKQKEEAEEEPPPVPGLGGFGALSIGGSVSSGIVSQSTVLSEADISDDDEEDGEEEEDEQEDELQSDFIIDDLCGRSSAHLVLSVRKYLQGLSVDNIPVEVFFLDDMRDRLCDPRYLFYRAIVLRDLQSGCSDPSITCSQFPSRHSQEFINFIRYRPSPTQVTEVVAYDIYLHDNEFTSDLSNLGISVLHLPTLRGVYKVADVKSAIAMQEVKRDPYQALVWDTEPLYRSQQETANKATHRLKEINGHVNRCLQLLKEEDENAPVRIRTLIRQMSELHHRLLCHRAAICCHDTDFNTDGEVSPLDATAGDAGDVGAWDIDVPSPLVRNSTWGGGGDDDDDDDECDEEVASLVPILTPTPSANFSTTSSETMPAAWHLEALLSVPAWLWDVYSDSVAIRELAMSHALSLCMQSLLPTNKRCFVFTTRQAATCSMVRHYQSLVCARVMNCEGDGLQGAELFTMDAWDGRLLGSCFATFRLRDIMWRICLCLYDLYSCYSYVLSRVWLYDCLAAAASSAADQSKGSVPWS